MSSYQPSALARRDPSGNGVDASYIAASATIAAALLAAFGAALLFLLGQRAVDRSRKRELCGKAIAEALAWLELPYRIRRRLDDNAETLRAMTDRIHQLQESLLFYSSWLRVELPEAHDDYTSLLGAIKSGTRASIQEAWRMPPLADASGMNIGEIAIDRARIDESLSEFTATVRKHFG